MANTQLIEEATIVEHQMTKIGLWAYRWSVARGWQWFLERRCNDSEKESWLSVYKNDEPNIIFKLSHDQPIDKPETSL